MPIVAFDNNEFRRGGKSGQFFTPLGAAVWIRDEAEFKEAFNQAERDLATSFGLTEGLCIRTSAYLKYTIGLRKAIPFCEKLISAVQNMIKAIQIYYVIIPPSKVPEIEVGGLGAGSQKIKTAQFLRELTPAFTLIMAWSFLGKTMGGVPDWELKLDGLLSK